MIIDEEVTKEQRDALIAIESGRHGGLIGEISAAVAPNPIDPLFAPITFKVDRYKRRVTVQIPGNQNLQIIGVTNAASSQAMIAIPLPMER